MSETDTLFTILGGAARPAVAEAIARLVREGTDDDLNRINVMTFVAQTGLDEADVTAGFLHAARLGLFDMSWNVLCPGCGGVLDGGSTLKSIDRDRYNCALCAEGYEPTLDDMVEVTFTVSPRVRKIAAHDPDTLPMWDYVRQVFWSSGVDLPKDFETLIDRVVLDAVDLPPGERAVMSLQLPAGFVIVFDPVTHLTQFLDVKGEPTRERQSLALVFTDGPTPNQTLQLHPGPLRISFENQTRRRALPAVWVSGEELHVLLGRRRPFLTARHMLTNQTFRDIYRTDTLDVNQRMKITSLTFLFTDLKGSTELYERVGDLVAYDLVRAHFRILAEIVSAEAGAVVKTIGDAVMATFLTPDRAVQAALRMRDAMRQLNAERGGEDLLLKIGIHEGPCLAVSLNDRQDYFGQTVNIASRVQNLAVARAIFATKPVATYPKTVEIFSAEGIEPLSYQASLRGVQDDYALYEIP